MNMEGSSCQLAADALEALGWASVFTR